MGHESFSASKSAPVAILTAVANGQQHFVRFFLTYICKKRARLRTCALLAGISAPLPYLSSGLTTTPGWICFGHAHMHVCLDIWPDLWSGGRCP